MKNDQRISKPNNRPTSILMQLLRWLTNLELSGGAEGIPKIRQLIPEQLRIDLTLKNLKFKIQNLNRYTMKTNIQYLKGLAMLFLLVVSTMGAMAQESQTLTQQVCPGTEPYKVTPDNASNTFLWSISPGTSGTEWTISSQTTVATDIIWANPATPQTYTVTFKEMAATGCYEEVNVVVKVNPLPVLVITDPLAVCSPGTVDLGAAAITAGSTLPAGTVLTYWEDALATSALAAPAAVNASGTYYIKAETAEGCSDIKAVDVLINPIPSTSKIFHN